MRDRYDYLVAGCGFAGSVVAERLASQLDATVMIVDRRNHIAGNAYDFRDETGLLVHRYGPHLFHTNSDRVFEHLSQFTQWRPYEHRVLASVDGQLLPVPINLDTVNRLYGTTMSSEEMAEFLERVRVHHDGVLDAEQAVTSRVGQDLYEKFFRGYTRKQWGVEPSELAASVTARIPVRTDRDDRYFTDRHQAIPLHGYTAMFERMLDHPNITVALGVDYRDLAGEVEFGHLVYTGPVDEFFGHKHGPLPYRSLRFEFSSLSVERFQPVGTVNYPNDHDYTRITEFKHITGEPSHTTSVVHEYPTWEGEPYYPVPSAASHEIYRLYEAEATTLANVTFVGRLATYRYYNMDQVVGSALTAFGRLAARRLAA